MTLRNSLVFRLVRAIRVSRGGLEPNTIRFPRWRHSRNRRGRWVWGWLRNTKILNLIKPCSPSNWSVRTSGHLGPQKSKNLLWWLSLFLRRGTSNITKRVLTLALHFRVLVESQSVLGGICNCCNLKETNKSWLSLWRSVWLNHYFRVFFASNVFLGF